MCKGQNGRNASGKQEFKGINVAGAQNAKRKWQEMERQTVAVLDGLDVTFRSLELSQEGKLLMDPDQSQGNS